ncbi:MAG: hypothetical protein PHQ27_05595 [Victivallales bacterium]|nr:hypothetical protein [Victivallales bacterium]
MKKTVLMLLCLIAAATVTTTITASGNNQKSDRKSKSRDNDPFVIQNSEIRKLQAKIIIFQKKKEEIYKRNTDKILKRIEILEKKKEKYQSGTSRNTAKIDTELTELKSLKENYDTFVRMPSMNTDAISYGTADDNNAPGQ